MCMVSDVHRNWRVDLLFIVLNTVYLHNDVGLITPFKIFLITYYNPTIIIVFRKHQSD